ncbi:unnamed protein product [Lepidochelys olivacea]
MMKTLVIMLAGLLLLHLAPGGLCQGCAAPRTHLQLQTDVYYTVVDGMNHSFNDSIFLTVPQGSSFFDVMAVAHRLQKIQIHVHTVCVGRIHHLRAGAARRQQPAHLLAAPEQRHPADTRCWVLRRP